MGQEEVTVVPADDDSHRVVGRVLFPSQHFVCEISSSVSTLNKTTKLTALSPDRAELFLEVDDDELVEEGEIVAGVPAVPDGQEDEGAELTDVSVVHELQSLVHVVHHLKHQ